MNRNLALAISAIALAAIAFARPAHAEADDDSDAYAIGLWGDMPYSPLQASVGVPNLIADMNAHRLAFTVHDGDLKAGSNSLCDDALYHQALGYFDALEAPAMFTPGDNDWTDCDRPSNGGFNSLERLDRERALFFPTPFSQANPGWDLSDPTRAPLRDPKTLAEADGQPDGFKDFLLALRDEVIAFRGPVAYVHGDSHYHRIDKPFLDAAGRRLENFTRVETFGDNAGNGNNDVHWTKVSVDPRSRDVFSYQAMIVPGNRTAVGAP